MASRTFALRAGRLASQRFFFGAKNTVENATARSFASTFSSSTTLQLQPANNVWDLANRRWFSESSKSTTDATPEEPIVSPPAEEAAAAANKEEQTTNTTAGEAQTEDAAKPSREKTLEAELKQLKNQLLTSLADQENTRRIAQNDVGQAKKFAIKSFAKSLLDVSDNLERALQAVPDGMEKNKDEHPVLANLYEGIELTGQGLSKAFEANGLFKYGEVGEPFDPNKHNALFEYPDPKQTPGTVGQVIKPGFMLSDRVLRPAEVGVVKKAE